MGIDWTEVIISICALVVTGIFVPCIKTLIANEKQQIDKQTQDTIVYWTEVGVRWAKQWLHSETGEKKKEEVLNYVSTKLTELGISISEDDLDKLIECVYEQVKGEKVA